MLGYVDAKLLMLGSGNTICRGGRRTLHLLKLDMFARIRRLDRVSAKLMRVLSSYHPKSGLRAAFGGRQRAIGLSVHMSSVAMQGRRLHVLALGGVGARLSSGRVSS